MQDTLKQIWANIYLRVIFIVLALIVLFKLIVITRLAWISFLTAFLIAYLVEPIVKRLERTKVFPRWLSIVVTMVVILLFFTVGVLLMGEVLAQLSVLPNSIRPLLSEDIPTLIADLEKKSPPWLAKIFQENTPEVQKLFEDQRNTIILWLQGLARSSVRNIAAFFGGVSRALFIIMMSAFIISSYTVIESSFLNVFPKRSRDFVADLLKKLDVSVGAYIRAKVVEAIIVGAVTLLAVLLLGVPKAAALSFIAAVLNPIPYLGPFMATIPIVLSALTISWQKALIALLVMGFIQILDGNILQPILLSQSVNVHPVIILISLLIGAAVLGLWGVLLAIPVAAFLQLIYTDYYLTSKWYQKD